MSARSKPLWREYAEAIVIAIILALFIRTFVVQAFKIPSGSMIPTLLIGDHLLVNKMSYGLQWPRDCRITLAFRMDPIPGLTCYTSSTLIPLGKPQRGDVIVFRFPDDEDKDFIKRVVGIPGDSVALRNKRVWINGELLPEPYVQHADPNIQGHPRDNLSPLTVPPESYFVMGDNRDHSMDSRFWGFVKLQKIKGKAFFIYASFKEQGLGLRWERLGKAIQ